MKKTVFLVILLLLILSSCSMSSYIPERESSESSFTDNIGIYKKAVDELKAIGKEVLITDTSVYRSDLAGDISGLYMIEFENGSEKSATHISSDTFSYLINNCKVKMIDTMLWNGSIICSFGFATPNHDFDWGYYYAESDTPIYIGDPVIKLSENGNGFIYEKKVSAMTTVTYYTEKSEDNFFYYELK